MAKNSTQITLVLVGLLIMGLAWGISPVLTKPTSAEVSFNRSDSPVFLTSAPKIVNSGGPVRTTISLWDGESPFLALVKNQPLSQRESTKYENNVKQFVIRGTQDKCAWPTNRHSLTTAGMVHEQSHTTCESTFSSRGKGGTLSVFIKRTDTSVPLSKPFHDSTWPVTFFFSGNKETDEHAFSMY